MEADGCLFLSLRCSPVGGVTLRGEDGVFFPPGMLMKWVKISVCWRRKSNRLTRSCTWKQGGGEERGVSNIMVCINKSMHQLLVVLPAGLLPEGAGQVLEQPVLLCLVCRGLLRRQVVRVPCRGERPHSANCGDARETALVSASPLGSTSSSDCLSCSEESLSIS